MKDRGTVTTTRANTFGVGGPGFSPEKSNRAARYAGDRPRGEDRYKQL